MNRNVASALATGAAVAAAIAAAATMAAGNPFADDIAMDTTRSSAAGAPNCKLNS